MTSVHGRRTVAVALAILLAYGVPLLARHLTLLEFGGWNGSVPTEDASLLDYRFIQHGMFAALSLLAILVLKRIAADYDFGLRWPNSLASLWRATGVALMVFAVFTVVNYLPNLIEGTAPLPPHPAIPFSLVGWFVFQGLWVGPTEEILFRGLVMGVLAFGLPGGMSWRGVKISFSNLGAAVLFGLVHVVAGQAWWQNLFHASYACLVGIVYGVWRERSRSLLAPSIAHNATDFAALLVSTILGAVWR